MAFMHKDFVSTLPGVTNAGGFLVWNCDSVDRVGVLRIQDEDVPIPTARGNRKTTSLVGI